MKIYHKTCAVCGKVFETEKATRITCSISCKRKRTKEKQREYAKRLEASRSYGKNFSKASKKYYDYCKKNGYVTYGQFKQIKMLEELKNGK